MQHNAESLDRRVGRLSAVTYTALSLVVALGFFTLATVHGGYNDVARFGGAVWVFLLSMIVSMPLVTAHYKQRSGQ